MNLPFIYQNPIILSLLKIVTLKFTMPFLTILTSFLKLYVIGKWIFYNSDVVEFQFHEHFVFHKV